MNRLSVTDTQSPCEFDEGAPLVQIGKRRHKFKTINKFIVHISILRLHFVKRF